MRTRVAFALTFGLLLSPVPVTAQEAPHLVAQIGHSDGIAAVAFSPDGNLIATTGKDTSIKLWHAATGQELVTIPGFLKEGTGVAFNHDGTAVIGVGFDGRIHSTTVTGKLLYHVYPDFGPLRAVAVSPDSKFVALATDGTVMVWEAGVTKPAAWHKTGATAAHALAFHPTAKEKLLAAACSDKTVKLLNYPEGKVLFTLTGHTQKVSAVAFSTDGKVLASGGDDGTVRLWKAPWKESFLTLKAHGGKVNAVAFSPDGKQLATAGDDLAVRFWDTTRDKEVGHIDKLTRKVTTLAFSPDGEALVIGSQQSPTAAVYRLTPNHDKDRRIQLLRGAGGKVNSVAFAPDGNAMAVATEMTVALWRLGESRPVYTLNDPAIPPEVREKYRPNRPDPESFAHESRVLAVAFSPDGRFLVSGGADRRIKLWSARDGRLLDAVARKDLPGPSAEVTGLAFSPDKKALTFASASKDRSVRLWTVTGGKLRAARTQPAVAKEAVQYFSVAFSPDGKTLAAGAQAQVRRWDAVTGAAQPDVKGHDNTNYYSVAFGPDGKQLAGGCQDGTVSLWNLRDGKERILHTPLSEQHGWPGCVESVAFSPDGKQLAVGSDDRTVRLWDPEKGKEVCKPLRHTQSVKAVAYGPDAKYLDGKFLLTASGNGLDSGHGDGSVKLWKFPPGADEPKLLCTLAAFPNGSWGVIEPRGLYDASNGGDVPWLHWVRNNEPIALGQLKEHFYEPRLLDKLLGFNAEPVRKVKRDVAELKPAPKVAAPSLDAKKKQMTVKVGDGGGGVGRVQVFVNNKEVRAEVRTDKVDPKTGEAEVVVDLSKVATLRGKGDEVRVVAWNKDGDLASRGMVRELDDTATAAPAPPELYAVVVGVSAYKEKRLNLRFAADDAEAVAQAMEKGAKRLFGADKVHVSVLSSSGKAGTTPATKDNVRKAFEAARGAKPGDVLVVFLAGHGVAPGGDRDLYCYLTQDAESLTAADYARGGKGEKACVNSDELVEWVKQVPALKQVMMLDTCASGAAAGGVALPLAQRRDVSSGQVRAVGGITERTGFHVLMGCAADKVSYEASQFEHGLLTYALLEGMRGPGVADDVLQAEKLFRYASGRVPQLAQGIGGIQEPLVSSPRNEPVGVAKLVPGDVPLKATAALLVRPLLRNAGGDEDDLKLSAAMHKRLSEPGALGKGATYVNAEELEDAWRPRGEYTVKGDTVTVTVRLRRDEKVVELPPIEGSKNDLAGLAERLVTATAKAVAKQ
jgi:WD40 repeat protein/uncharacterized caspase-like protein